MKISKKMRTLSLMLFIVMFVTSFHEITMVAAEELHELQKYEEKVTDVSTLSDFLSGLIDTTEIEGVLEEPIMIVEQEVPVEEKTVKKAARASAAVSPNGMPESESEVETEIQTQVIPVEPESNELYVRMDDGTTNYYSFSEDIKFEDENGNTQYKEVNIVDQPDRSLFDKGYEHANGTNDFRINFSRNPGKGVYVKDDAQQFSLQPVVSESPENSQDAGEEETEEEPDPEPQIESSNAEIVGEIVTVERDEEETQAFEYRGVYGNNTALRFLPQLNAVKTEIILDEYTGQNEFSFYLDTYGKKAILSEDKRFIDIVEPDDDESVITQFLSPFAYDAEGGEWLDEVHYTDDVHYELEDMGDSVYKLTYVVSEDFLTSEETVYPVTIDPVTGNVYNSVDVPIYSASSWKAKKMGNEQTNCFGRTSQYGNGRVLVKFNIPSAIKEGATINSAEYFFRELTGRTTNTYVRPYIVTKAWDNNTTWDSKPSYDTGSGMTRKNIKGSSNDLPGNKHWYSFELKNAVQKWVKGTANNGVIFVSEEEGKTTNNWRSFASKETTTSNWRPYVVINYTNDTAAPTITDVTGNPTAWTKNDVKLTVTGAKDTGAGLHATPYSFSTTKDSYKWQASATSPTFNKNQTVYVYLRDKLGNIALRKTVTINKIDKDAPTITDAKPGAAVNGKVKIAVTGAKDAGSGLHATPYSFSTTKDSYSWQASATSAEFDYTKTVYVYVRDTLGNIALRKTINIKDYDKVAPTISKVDVNHDNLTVTVTATDTDSGIGGYSFDGGVTWQTANKKTFSVPEFGVQIKVKDKIGNIATYGTKYNVGETRADALPYIYEENGIYKIYHANAKAALQYKIGDGAWTNYKDEIPVPPHNDVKVYVRVKDTAISNEYFVKAQVGVYTEEYEDAKYNSLGTDIAFKRYYSSDDTRWRFSFEYGITDLKGSNNIVSPNVKVVQYPDGHTENFFMQKEGTYQSQVSPDTLRKEGEIYHLQNGLNILSYDKDGRLISQKDQNGNTISYSWTISSGKKTKLVIKDSVNRTFTIIYQNDKPVSISLPENTILKYMWSGENLTTYTNAVGVDIKYSYNSGHLTDNGKETIEYLNNGRLSKVAKRNGASDTYTYNDANNEVSVKSSESRQSSYTYDVHFWKLTETDEDQNVVVLSYHKNGLLQSRKENGVTTHYSYDGNRNLTHKIIQDTTIEQNRYNSRNLLEFEEDQEEKVTTYTYDSKGNTAAQIIWKGAVGNVNDANAVLNKVEYTYQANGLIKTAKYKESKDTLTNDGNVASEIVDVKLESYTYDQYGNKTSMEVTDYTSGTAVKTKHTYSFDIHGNMLKEVDGNGLTTVFSYDVLRQKTSETINGVQHSFKYDDQSRIVEKKSHIDGKSHKYVYNSVGNLVEETDKNGNKITLTYDNVGNLKQKTFYGYIVDFDPMQNVTSVNIGNQNLLKNTYSNDSKKVLAKSVYGNNQTISYTHTDADKVASISYQGEAARFQMTYDVLGQLKSVKNTQDGTTWSQTDKYIEVKDKTGKVIHSIQEYEESEASNSFDGVKETVDGKEFLVKRQSNSEQFVLNNNKFIRRDYVKNSDEEIVTASLKHSDAAQSAIETSIEYKEKGAISKITHKTKDKTFVFQYSYDEKGNITQISNGTYAIDYVYDSINQLVRVNDAESKLTIVYEYDSRGNVMSRKEYAYSTGVLGSPKKTFSFTYDPTWKDKLVSYDGKNITHDPIGNPLTYDGWSFVWEGGRQLKQISKSGTTIKYEYDQNGIRTTKNVNGTTTTYTRYHDHYTSQSDGKNTLYFRYDESDNLLGLNYNGTEYFYVKNAHRDIMAITDHNGNVVVQYQYDAFGAIRSISGKMASTLGVLNPMRYRSYYYDDETGLYYLKSRYYHPEWGRFISIDQPELVTTFQEQSINMNLFVYCENEPVSKYDPTGYMAAAAVAGGYIFKAGLATSWSPVGWALLAIGAGIALGAGIAYAHRTLKNGSKKRLNDKHTKKRPGHNEKKKRKNNWSNRGNKKPKGRKR